MQADRAPALERLAAPLLTAALAVALAGLLTWLISCSLVLGWIGLGLLTLSLPVGQPWQSLLRTGSFQQCEAADSPGRVGYLDRGCTRAHCVRLRAKPVASEPPWSALFSRAGRPSWCDHRNIGLPARPALREWTLSSRMRPNKGYLELTKPAQAMELRSSTLC